MATSADFAAAAAACGSSPETYDTLAEGSLAVRARNGELGIHCGRINMSSMLLAGGGGTGDPPGGLTCADPPPLSTPTSACPPIRTTDLIDEARGRTCRSLRSRTMLFSAIFWAMAYPFS